jgi:hypothetical protein
MMKKKIVGGNISISSCLIVAVSLLMALSQKRLLWCPAFTERCIRVLACTRRRLAYRNMGSINRDEVIIVFRLVICVNNGQRQACVNSTITRERCARMASRAPDASRAMIAAKIRWWSSWDASRSVGE